MNFKKKCKIKRYLFLVLFCFTTSFSFSQTISPLLYGINAWMPHQYGANEIWGKMDQLWGKVHDCHVGFIRVGGIVPDYDQPTNAQYISMIDSIRKVGAEPLIQVSYANGTYTETQAANLVKYINVDMARNVKYWSIANEPDGKYGFSTPTPIATYFRKFATAMKSIDPTIKIVGPDLSYLQFDIYRSLIGGSDDITGKDANGNYMLDVIAFHSYMYAGEQTRSQVITEAVNAFQEKADSMNVWINKSNVENVRTGANALTWAVTEFNIDYQNPITNNVAGVGANSFINGQHWAECLGICMKNSALSFMPWSVHESNGDRSLYDLGFLDGLDGAKPRSSYCHLQLMSLYNKTEYAASTSNKSLVKVVSTMDNNGTTVMILNEELSTSFDYTIRLDNTSITSGSALKINVNKGQTAQYTSTLLPIPAQATHVVIFDNGGTVKSIVEYSLTDAQNQVAPRVIYTSSITALPLTVSAPIITLTKLYNGTTTVAVTAGTLSGVELADVNNVILTAIGTYDDASAGTGKAVTVNYSLSGSAAYKYSILPVKTYSNGEIKRKQLSILNVKVVTNKVIDGNTMAVVSYNGDLQGVLAIDANNVSVKAVANYDNATVGVNKTITVVYTLAGTAKDNYVAPTETVINNAEITDVIILNSLDASQTMSCEGSDLVLLYRVISGTPTKWRFSYDGAAQVAGVNTSAYNNLSTPDANGTISIVIPTTGMLPGNYKGSLQVQSESGVESPAYTFQFTVNVSSDNVVKMYDDVVTCDNKSNRFVAYQWYKNGFAINGATKQFYCEKDGLNGTYSVQVTTTDGQVLTTCSKSFTTTTVKTVNAYPNPIKSNQSLTVQADGFDNLELENSTLSVYDTFGTLVYQSSKVEKLNMLNLPLAPKVYVGHIKLKNGSDYVFKVIVE